jgi:uncharacterized protein YkwD
MARRQLSVLLVAAAAAAIAPSGASAAARIPCPGETAVPTAANLALVSNAVFCLTNQVRTSYGLAAFRRDARLDTAARLHSEDMAARNYFAHNTPEGLGPSDRSAAQGYPGGAGENIAMGYPTARAAVLAWMQSAGHCRNILGEGRDIGVGTANPSRPYYTQNFGDYDFGSGGAAAAGCPYTVNLDTLVLPDALAAVGQLPAVVPGLVATVANPATSATSPTAAVEDAPAPALGRLGLSTVRLRPGGRGTVSLTLSAPSTVALRFERRSGNRYRLLSGSLVADGHEGANRFTFRARLRGRALAAGRYRLRVVATDDAGRASAPRRVGFRVVR